MNNVNILRLVKDIKEIKNSKIDNIYYEHDEQNMFKGYAMIIGNKNTIYEYGYYFFQFNFPETYPFQPPEIVFYTSDKITRFHPNLYTCGRICLSIINTWRGESWTSCQTIKSVLLIILSILENNPIVYEPGLTIDHPDCQKYNDMIFYKNIEVSIIKMLNKKLLNEQFYIFYDIMLEKFNENKENILNNINKCKEKYKNNDLIEFILYDSKYLVNFDYIEKQLKIINKI